MPRFVRIFVEGSKDMHFLHEFILRNFFDHFTRDSNPLNLRNDRIQQTTRLKSVDGSVMVELYRTNGWSTLDGFENEIRHAPVECAGGMYIPIVIYDADENADARREEVLEMLNVDPDKRSAAGESVFLFPDNGSQGALERLMRGLVADEEMHMRFFDSCWMPFDRAVCSIPNANKPSEKSMMNEYAAAFDKRAWEDNGINKCFVGEGLWQWDGPAGGKLRAFLEKYFFQTVPTTLGDLLP